MEEIARFTKQQIPSKVVEGFGPEPGERAEPIAMGRQTIWGGAGRPPSREVMMAAAKAARTEMMQRVRENKAGNGGSGRGASGGGARNGGGNGAGRSAQPQGQRNGNGNGNGNGGGYGGGSGGRSAPRPAQQARPAQNRGPAPSRDSDDYQPRDGAHNSSSPFVQRDATPRNTDGQPDPLRTSVDSMGGRGRRNGNGGGGGGRSNRSGGGGYGARGPGNPARTFGR